MEPEAGSVVVEPELGIRLELRGVAVVRVGLVTEWVEKDIF